MKKRFTEDQIIGFVRETEAGLAVAEPCLMHGFSEASHYLWRSKFDGMNESDAKIYCGLKITPRALPSPI